MDKRLLAIEIRVEGQEDEHFVFDTDGFASCSTWDLSHTPETKALAHMIGLMQSFTRFEVIFHTQTC